MIGQMPESNFLRIQLHHDHWATAQIIDACRPLSGEQFHRRFDIGPGSLHDTLVHIVGAKRTWTDTLAQGDIRPRIEEDGQRRTPDQIMELWNQVHAAFAEQAFRCPADEMVSRVTRGGWSVQLTRAAVLTHVTTHGMHHRAQCLNMLRQLGVNPLPRNSVVEWVHVGEPLFE